MSKCKCHFENITDWNIPIRKGHSQTHFRVRKWLFLCSARPGFAIQPYWISAFVMRNDHMSDSKSWYSQWSDYKSDQAAKLRKYKAKSTPSGFQGSEGVNTILGKDRYWSARSILLHLRRLDTCGHLGYYSARSVCCSSTMRVSAIMAKKFVKCL